MNSVNQYKTVILLAVAMMTAACGGSSSEPGPPANRAPVANAGANVQATSLPQ